MCLLGVSFILLPILGAKFYPQILSTEDSIYIYERPLTEILIFAVLERRLLQLRETEASFCFYNFVSLITSQFSRLVRQYKLL